MSVFAFCWIIKCIMVLNVFDQTITQITTCIGNRPWIAPNKRTIDYQNVLMVNPIEVITKSRSADRPYKHRNGVNHGNLSHINISHIAYADQSNVESQSLNISVLNAQSACNKVDKISNNIVENNSDIVFLSETWIPEHNDFTCDQISPRTHTMHHVPVSGKLGRSRNHNQKCPSSTTNNRVQISNFRKCHCPPQISKYIHNRNSCI